MENNYLGQIPIAGEYAIAPESEPIKLTEEYLPLSKMFEFINWKDTQNLMYDSITKEWYNFEVSSWVKIGNNIDLWNKFKERP